MTKLFPFAFIALLCVGACGDDAMTIPPVADAAVIHDLSVARDAAVATMTCIDVLQCVSACGQNLSCQRDCQASAPTDALTNLAALVTCIYDACSMSPDGGTVPCSSQTDVSAACTACGTKIAQGITMGTSTTCLAEFTACVQ